MQVSYNLTQGLGAVDHNAPGSYNTSLYPFVTFNEATQIERRIAGGYGETSINAIALNEDRMIGSMNYTGKYRKGTAQLASSKLALELYNLNAQKQKMAVDAATVKAQNQLVETAKAAAAKAQADTLTALQNAGLVKKTTSTSEAQKIIDGFNQSSNNNTTPAEKTGMSTQTKLIIGGTLLAAATLTTIAVIRYNKKNNANKKRNGY